MAKTKHSKNTTVKTAQLHDSCNWSNAIYRTDIVLSYANWVQRYIYRGWNAYLLTFMFNQMPGSKDAKVAQMQQEITGVYNKLLTRVVRKPRSPAWAHLLPRALIVPDLPVSKKTKQDIRDISINDGLHHHGIFLIPPISRIVGPLDIHFQEQEALYRGGSGRLRNIHIQTIDHTPKELVAYAMKGLKWGRFSDDQILILPRSLSEL